MAGPSIKVPLYTIAGILGALLFSMFVMYLFVLFILEYTLNIHISMDNIGYWFVAAFVMTIIISGLFYMVYVERRAQWYKV